VQLAPAPRARREGQQAAAELAGRNARYVKAADTGWQSPNKMRRVIIAVTSDKYPK